jgi:hypothetical protein
MTLCSGCATRSPCDYSANPTSCDASIEVINGILVLTGPACSRAEVFYEDRRNYRVDNISGNQPIGKSNQEVTLVRGSCKAYPQR